MQDKDMDQLFRSKLDGFEMEPSAHVWENISREIGQPQQRKSIIPMLRIAASVAILISAGLYFLPKKQVNVEDPKNPKMAMNPATKPQNIAKTDKVKQEQTKPAVNVQPVIAKLQPTQQIANVNHNSTGKPTNVTADVTPKTAAPVKTDPIDNQQQALATATPKTSIITPAMPDGPISIKSTDPVIDQSKAVLAMNTPSVTTDENSQPAPVKKHRIHGFGSLLNAAVALVDKREDKIIEFTDTDERNTVTGINLGIIKVKKDK